MTGAPDDFVGRTVERAQLAAAVNGRSGGALLVAGPAGVGKTRLLAESLSDLATPLVWGSCWQGDGVPPFWPWLQVLRSCLNVHESTPAGTVSALLGDDAPVGEATRFAMFERVVELLGAAGRAEGLVVVLDDLHWADEASIRLLAFATRAPGASGVRFVGAYRDDEVGPEQRFIYAASVLHCLPVGMITDDSAATGTVIRASIVRDYASSAGFAATTVLPVEHPQFRLYRLEG